jgi:Transcriptional regulator, AbiEi antitoxin, Type IV TA system/Transcriptional regulator, AbiEi antitoxin N-terminal domain
MALTPRHNLIKRLQTAFPHGTPFDHHQLTKLGVSSALAHHYLKSGWLTRLGRGVFMFPNDALRREDCLKFLSRQMPGFHVGGKTALAWRGVRHNLPAREPLALWGEGNAGLPEWFQQRFPSRYTTRNPFAPGLPKYFGLQPLPESPEGVLVSVPERALLELLSEVAVHQGIEEARNIMEGARSFRPEVLTTLLKNCRRVKVVRLCVSWAEELNLPWATAAKTAAKKRLGHGRWTHRLKDGTFLVLKS